MSLLDGIRDLLASERGVFAIALALCAGAMVIVGKMTTDQWINFNEWLGGVLIASKTVTTAVEIAKRPPAAATPAAPALVTPPSVGLVKGPA